MIGAVPAVVQATGHALGDIPRQPGLYAVRRASAPGASVWASLAGELLASQLNGDPPPLARIWWDAMDPAPLPPQAPAARLGRRRVGPCFVSARCRCLPAARGRALIFIYRVPQPPWGNHYETRVGPAFLKRNFSP